MSGQVKHGSVPGDDADASSTPPHSTARVRLLDADGRMGDVSGERVDALIRLLWEVGEGMNGLQAAMARTTGAHPTDLAAIARLGQADEPLTIGELGAGLGLTKTAATGVVDRLERAGHVERVRDSRDRRRVHLRVTATAEAVAEQVLGDYVRRMRAVLAGYTDAQLDVTERFLVDLRDALAGHGDAGNAATTGR